MDNKKDIGTRDRSRINLSEDYELSHWSEKFGISKAELRNAVKQAGPMVKDIEAFLKNNK
ncbi:MAG: DUF3606 domain-containing protein [Ginsengibacter sp.]